MRAVLSTFICLLYRIKELNCNTYFLRKIFPTRINTVYQFLFPHTLPVLELFLSTYSIFQSVINFEINQFINIVFAGEAFINMQFMLCHSTS